MKYLIPGKLYETKTFFDAYENDRTAVKLSPGIVMMYVERCPCDAVVKSANMLFNVGGPIPGEHYFGEGFQTPQIIHLPPRHEVRNAYSTHQKSEDLLMFEHRTSLLEGITQMWKWALTQPNRERQVWDKYELEKGLYPYWKQDALKDGFWNGKTDASIVAGDGVIMGDRSVIKDIMHGDEEEVELIKQRGAIKNRRLRNKESHPVMGNYEELMKAIENPYTGSIGPGELNTQTVDLEVVIGVPIDREKIRGLVGESDSLSLDEAEAGIFRSPEHKIMVQKDIASTLEATREMLDDQVLPAMKAHPAGMILDENVTKEDLDHDRQAEPQKPDPIWPALPM